MSAQTDLLARKALAIPRVSYAQNCEDILLDRIFRDQPRGTFVDVGANHPRIDSNTYFFYLRGWRGVNLEPIARFRTLFDEERPEDLNLGAAVSDSDGEIVLHEIANDADETGHSSVLDDVANVHRPLGFQIHSYPVPARTIAGLVAEHSIEPPDFMSIDVEGHEAAVLRGVPWDSWRPRALVIESIQSLTHEATHEEWEPALLSRGYVFAAFNGLNRFYLREDLADRLDRLAAPVNVLDHFERSEIVEAREKIGQMESSLRQSCGQYDQLVVDRQWDRDNFRRIEEGWRFGLEQAESARAAWTRETEEFHWHRTNFERAQAEYDKVRADFERDRGEFDRDRSQFDRDRASWEEERQRLEQEVQTAERNAGELHRQLCEIALKQRYAERLLVETQTELRPYRLLDRLGIVRAGYAAARKMKRKIKPRIAS